MAIPSLYSRATSSVYDFSGKLCNRFAENRLVKNSLEKFYNEPAKAAGKMLLYSIVSKDAINCILYTYQSWYNEKIPADKRKFVALGDLVNGFVMVGGQLLAGKVVDKMVIPNVQSHYTGTLKDANNKEYTVRNSKATSRFFHQDNLRAHLEEVLKEKGIDAKHVKTEEILEKVVKRTKAPYISGLGIILTTLFTTALIKRTLAPLVSTPLAGAIKKKYIDSDKKAKDVTEGMPIAVSARHLDKTA